MNNQYPYSLRSMTLAEVYTALHCINRDITTYVDIHPYHDGVIRLRRLDVLHGILCELLHTFNPRYLTIVKRIYEHEYPTPDEDWYLVHGHIYIGAKVLKQTRDFVSVEGLPSININDLRHCKLRYISPKLWVGLSTTTILRLLHDTSRFVQLFGCRYVNYMLRIRMNYAVDYTLVQGWSHIMLQSHDIVLLEALSIVELFISKKIDKEDLQIIKKVCVDSYVKPHSIRVSSLILDKLELL